MADGWKVVHMKIVITAPFAAQQVEELKGQHEVLFSPQDDSTPLRSEEQLHSLLAEERAEIFITESDRVTAQVLAGLDDLKLLCVCRTGLNNIDIPACTDHGVALVNAPGRNAAAVADMVMALFIDMSRFLFEGEKLLRSGQWDEGIYYRLRGHELYGNTVATIGFGAIPKELAKRISGFGMKMIAYDPYVSAEIMASYGVEKVTLEEAFSGGDYVTLHLPVTEQTRHMVNRDLLKLMKPSAYFVNAARSAIVVEEDVLELLEKHQIAGAAFDVYEEEPLGLDSRFLKLDHTILIPHLGGASLDVVDNHSRMITTDIVRFISGQKPEHLVNPMVLG